MKITLVNRSDSLGGAAIVTVRLLHALRALGHDARLLVFDAPSSPLPPDVVSQIGSPLSRSTSFLAERLAVMASDGFSRRRLFQIDPALTGIDISSHPWIREADAVLLNWVNQGMLSLSDIRRIADVTPRLLITMHDMWWLTGVCHHAHSCRRFTEGCGRCPLLGWMKSSHDLSRRVYEAKKRLYAHSTPRFIAVSNWLADLCLLSPSFRGIRPDVILNAFPIESYPTPPSTPTCLASPLNLSWQGTAISIPSGTRLILMGAARLDDPVKGLPLAIRILNRLAELRPDISASSHVIFFGALRDSSALSPLHFPHTHIGMVTDPELLRALYSRATALISTSLAETLPGTLVEAQAAGCTPVAFDRGGQSDIITDPSVGRLVPFPDVDAFSLALADVIDSPASPSLLHHHVASRFDALSVARRYVTLIRSL